MQTASEPQLDRQRAETGREATNPLRRIALWSAVLVVLASYTFALLIPVYSNRTASDFAAPFYPAAQLLLSGGDPYPVTSYIYMQPPALLFLIAPLTALPAETARAVWLVIEVLLLALAVAATIRALDYKLTDLRAAFMLVVYLSPNIVWGLMIGQSVIFIFLLQALGLVLLRSGKPFLAGLSLGAIVLKPHLLAVELPILLSAPRRAWAGAATSAAAILLLPELFGIHLLGSFAQKLVSVVGEERYNKLNPADMFVNLGGDMPILRALGWALLVALGLFYLWLLWRVWRERDEQQARWELTPAVQRAMLAAFTFLPYTLAYDIILVAAGYLWRFRANGYSLDRPLTWNIGLLWLLPFLTLLLHALGVPSTVNPLLIIGLLLLLNRPAGDPVNPKLTAEKIPARV